MKSQLPKKTTRRIRKKRFKRWRDHNPPPDRLSVLALASIIKMIPGRWIVMWRNEEEIK